MRAPTPWLSRDFLIAGKVTLLVGDAWRAGVPLSLAWAAGLAAGRPVGAFAPRTRFRSLVYSRVGFHEVHRRALTAAAERLGAAPSEIHEAVRLLPPREALSLADIERDIVDHEAALLVLAPAKNRVAALRALAKRHRVAVLLVHDAGSANVLGISEHVRKTPTIQRSTLSRKHRQSCSRFARTAAARATRPSSSTAAMLRGLRPVGRGSHRLR